MAEPILAERPASSRVENREGARGVPDRQEAPIRARRDVEHRGFGGAAQHAERCGRAAQQDGEQVAAGGDRVVELDPGPGEQQRVVEVLVVQRLGS